MKKALLINVLFLQLIFPNLSHSEDPFLEKLRYKDPFFNKLGLAEQREEARERREERNALTYGLLSLGVIGTYIGTTIMLTSTEEWGLLLLGGAMAIPSGVALGYGAKRTIQHCKEIFGKKKR